MCSEVCHVCWRVMAQIATTPVTQPQKCLAMQCCVQDTSIHCHPANTASNCRQHPHEPACLTHSLTHTLSLTHTHDRATDQTSDVAASQSPCTPPTLLANMQNSKHQAFMVQWYAETAYCLKAYQTHGLCTFCGRSDRVDNNCQSCLTP